MVIRRSVGEIIFDNINTLFLSILSLIFIYPLLYCLFASISDPERLFTHIGPLLSPMGIDFNAYAMVFSSSMIIRGLINTAFYVFVGTSLNLLLTSFAAYVLSRKGYYWKNFIMFYIVFTMYFGGGLIPTYLVVKSIHLIDTPLAIILPTALNTFYIIVMRTYFIGIPDSLEESAIIDGANDFAILFRIILPVAMPVIAVMIIYYGVGQWNSWFGAMIYLVHDTSWQPLQLILRNLLLQTDPSKLSGSLGVNDGQLYARLIKYALIIVTVIPILLIYPFMQKHFITGVMIGSLKE